MAQWIWYPRDYEFYLGLQMYSKRTERGMWITPNWDVNSFHHNVIFVRDFTLEEDTCVKIHTTGSFCIILGDWYVPYDEEKGLEIPKGEHTIIINVFNKNDLPALYIDHPILGTGEGWYVGPNKLDMKPAAFLNFTEESQPPIGFSYAYERREAVAVEMVNQGTLYDFGQEMMAKICVDKIQGEGQVLICLGESREEALDADNCTIFEKRQVVSCEESTDLMDIAQAFRYVWMCTDEQVVLDGVYADYEFLPLQNRGAFRSSEAMLNTIYDIAVHTLHLCTREFCLDGVKRDRWAWSGDATQSYLLQYYSFFDLETCKRTMRLLRGKEQRTLHLNTIQDYTLYWFVSLWDYYLYSGDSEFLKEIYPDARSMMEDLCLKITDERGFLTTRNFDWVFVDWSKHPDINVGDVSFIQLLFARALETMAYMAELVGENKEYEKYKKLHETLKEKIFAVFWDEKKGCFTNGPAKDAGAFVTKYTNMFAMMFGYLNDKQKESIKQAVFRNNEVPEIVTPYMKFYELLALGELGMYEELHEYLMSYWGGMVELGCTSFWEEYDPQMEGIEHYRQGTRKFGKSLCHAWGAGPILLFGKHYLGVKPLTPGYETFAIEPHLMGLDMIEGTVPVPNGHVTVKVTKKECMVENCSECKGELIIDGRRIVIDAHARIRTER